MPPSARPNSTCSGSEEQLSAAHLRLARTYVECLPYHEVIKRYDKPETVFYIDPPYWDCEGYYGKGIFSREDFAVLAGLLAGIKGKFILSLNDTPGVRETFAASPLKLRRSTIPAATAGTSGRRNC